MPGASARLAMLGRGIQPTFDFDFTRPSLPAGMTYSRSSVATDGLWTDPPGSSYNTYAIDQPRMLGARGYLGETARGNRALNSTAPANHTTPNMTVATWTFWMIGTGSATIAPNTAVGTGWGTITQGNPIQIPITTTGTANITVTGSVNRFQLENGPYPSSFIETVGAVVNRSADILYMDTQQAMPLPPRQCAFIVDGVQLGVVGLQNNWFASYSNAAGNVWMGVKNNSGAHLSGNPNWGTSVSYRPIIQGQYLQGGVAVTGANTYGAGFTGGQPMERDGAIIGYSDAVPLTLTRFYMMGLGNGGQALIGFLRRFRFYPFALTNNEFLQIMRQSQ